MNPQVKREDLIEQARLDKQLEQDRIVAMLPSIDDYYSGDEEHRDEVLNKAFEDHEKWLKLATIGSAWNDVLEDIITHSTAGSIAEEMIEASMPINSQQAKIVANHLAKLANYTDYELPYDENKEHRTYP